MDNFKDLVWDNLVRAALNELYVAFPVLAIPPFSWVVEFIVDQLSSKLYIVAKEIWEVNDLILKNEQSSKAYERADVALKIIAKSKGIESQEFKDAREAKIIEMRNHVRSRRAA